MLLKASTARNRPFKMISSADHLSLKTGLTPTVNLSKDNGAFGAAAGAITENANGWYNLALTIADTNTKGALAYYITAAGADDTDFADEVVTDLPGDTVASVTGAVGSVTARVTANSDQLGGQAVALDANNLLKVDVEDWKAGAVPATTITGIPKVDVADWLGTAVTAAAAGVPDVNTKNINNVAAATPGAAGGVLIAGHNAAATFDAGLVINQSALNTPALTLAGNGTGAGLQSTGGATGPGAKLIGGGTSGDGLDISTTAGDGISILPTAGSAIVGTANGTSKHGAVLTGGTAGTSDGLKCNAGTGGVDLRANITGSLSGAVGSVTARVTANTDQIAGVAAALDANNLLKVDVEDWKGAVAPANTGDSYARLGVPVGASVSADIAGVPAATLLSTVETNGAAITRTVRDALKLCLAGFGGNRSGFGTAAPAIADTAGLGKTRILGSSADGIGNATVTLDTTGG